MKVKLMPMLAAVMALATAATPFTVKAQAIPSGQKLPAQAQQQQFQWAQLNPSDVQKWQRRQMGRKTRKPLQAVYTALQWEKLKNLKASRQGQNHQQWQQQRQQ